jgi:hypothetical protein
MDNQLRDLAQSRYRQPAFLSALFELALEEQWFDVQHMVQHDMAKAILADYSLDLGRGYLNHDIFNENWEEVIGVGWEAFCEHTGLPMEKVQQKLALLRER